MITNCPICKRIIVVHWPQHWVYRRGPSYYCGDQCMSVAIVRDQKLLNAAKRIRSARKMNGKITPEMKKKAAEIAISGGSPLKYLKECGAKNPSASWQYIRKTLEKTDPDTFAKLPDKLPKISQETPDTVPTVKVDGQIRIETPEAGKIEVVEKPIGGLCPPPEEAIDTKFQTAAVRNKKLGTFYYDEAHGTIDWRHPYGEEISLFPEDYRLLRDSLDTILDALEV